MCRPNCRNWWSGIVAIHPDTVDIGAALVQAMEEDPEEMIGFAASWGGVDDDMIYFAVNHERYQAIPINFEWLLHCGIQVAMYRRQEMALKADNVKVLNEMWQAGSDDPG